MPSKRNTYYCTNSAITRDQSHNYEDCHLNLNKQKDQETEECAFIKDLLAVIVLLLIVGVLAVSRPVVAKRRVGGNRCIEEAMTSHYRQRQATSHKQRRVLKIVHCFSFNLD